MKLGIAIPALNEEDNIESVIQRSLAARQYIQDHSSVTDVEVTVVSDGSTDRPVELASRYKDLILLITRCIEYVLGLVRERVQYWQQLRKPQAKF
jgi:glycosyltransferase involved in cell wall biosynthesis